MKQYKKFILLAGASLLLGGSSLMGAEPSAASIMDKAYRYIGGLDSYAFDAVISSKNEEGKKLVQNVSVKVDRPDKFRADSKGDIKDRSIYFNQGLFTMIDHRFNYYGQLKTPRTIDGTLDFIYEKYGIKTPLEALLYSDMYKRSRYKNIKYFGTRNVGGTECDYVAFKAGTSTVHVWVSRGKEPLVKSFAVIENVSGKSYRKDTSIKWNTQAHFSDSDFVFKAPKGAAKISIVPAD